MAHTEHTNEAVIALSNRLIELAAQQSPTHRLVLEALLVAFIAVGKTHRCCTESAAMGALAAAERLMSHARPGTAPAAESGHVH